MSLASKSVQGTSLALQSVHNVHCCDSLPLGVLSVSDSITDNILQEHLENPTGLLIDEAADTLHTTTTSETADSWLGDPLDVVSQDLPVALGASLAETFASFAASRHVRSRLESE